MAAGSFVVVRRTISQTIVPYKDVEERLLLKRSKPKSTSLGFSSTNNVARCGVGMSGDTKKTQKTLSLERSRSEVCLRRKSSYIRETSLDVFEERREEGLVKPVVRRREIRRVNTSRPQSDFFPEFSINNEKVKGKEKASDAEDAGKRLGRCIATLKREMMSLRKQDQELLKQLTSLNEHIQDLKKIAKTQGGIYGSIEDHEGIKQTQSATYSSAPITMDEKKSSGYDHEENTDATKKQCDKKNRKNELTAGKRIKNDIKGLQETSFEYIEVPCNTSNSDADRAKATAKRSHSTTAADVSRKKISSLRLERKSLSCQFLNSERRPKKSPITESHETLASTDSRRTRPFSQLNTEHSRNLNEAIMKKKSLSLSQLRPSTKTTEGSTSDSECSTSGCYGGSSTGSDVELERGCHNAKAGCSESKEQMDKIIELNSLNLKPIGKRYLAINAQGPYRKKIVSV